MDEKKTVEMEEVMQEEDVSLTMNSIVRIRLDENGRCIAMDCAYLDSDIVIEKERSELPLPYSEFARKLDEYIYKNGEFIHQPIEYEIDPIQRIMEEQERQGKALEEVISMLLGE